MSWWVQLSAPPPLKHNRLTHSNFVHPSTIKSHFSLIILHDDEPNQSNEPIVNKWQCYSRSSFFIFHHYSSICSSIHFADNSRLICHSICSSCLDRIIFLLLHHFNCLSFLRLRLKYPSIPKTLNSMNSF